MNLIAWQSRVGRWVLSTFGEKIAGDKRERATRVLEEALELAQVAGVDKDRIARLTDIVYGKPVGEVAQEIGGLLVTVLAFAESVRIVGEAALAVEVERIEQPDVAARIRGKQAKKADLGVGLRPESSVSVQVAAAPKPISPTFDRFQALKAVVTGNTSGPMSQWPWIRAELEDLMAERDRAVEQSKRT